LQRKANKSFMSDIITTKNKFLIVVAGPTGVGKSALSMKIASRYNAEIFSADSRQIYQEMSIGTAKPSLEDLKKIRHHFINEISITETYSVGRFVADFHKKLHQFFLTKNIAVVTGGTGLYINAALEGMDVFPDVPEVISMEVNKWYQDFGLKYIQDELLRLDPEYYQIVDNQNPRRILRALEVIHFAGKPYSAFLGQSSAKTLPCHVIHILLDLPREILYDRINKRVDQMIKEGLEDEARSLHQFKHLRALQTVGYSEMFDYFEGKHDVSRAVDLIKQNSRRYAKRQITWFKKYGAWHSFHSEDDDKIFNLISEEISVF
jgi:tRNA dimethylallyltransferase